MKKRVIPECAVGKDDSVKIGDGWKECQRAETLRGCCVAAPRGSVERPFPSG